MRTVTFQPALDPYHAVFRMLRLHNIFVTGHVITFDHLRLLDFYLLFPFRFDEIRLAPTHRGLKKIGSLYAGSRPYGGVPDSNVLFGRMRSIQSAAIDTLLDQGYLASRDPDRIELVVVEKEAPEDLRQRVSATNSKQAELMEALKTLATHYPINGPNGLKARTGLLEHRYDPV